MNRRKPEVKHSPATITAASLILALILPLAGTALAQEEAKPAVQAPKPDSLALRKRAAGLMNAGKFAQAMALLKGAQPEFPADQDLRFLIGLCALETEQPGEAIAQFEAMLAAEPQLLRVRLDLARAYTMQRDFDKAREHFAIVMASNPPPQVGDNVQKFLAMMEAHKPWQLRLSAALVSDSNVNTGPGSSSVLSGFTSNTITGRSDTALNLVAAVNHVQAIDADMAWQSEANINVLDYTDEDDSDLLMLSLSSGPSWRMGKYTYSFPVVYDNIRVGGDAYNQSIGIAPQIRYEYDKDIQFNGGFTRSWKKHDPVDADPNRDGELLGIFAGARVDLGDYGVLQPALRLSLDQTEQAHFDNQGVALSLGYSLPLPHSMGLFLQPSITRVSYDAPDPFFAATCNGCTRRDWQYQFTANLSKTYGKSGLGAALGYTYTRNDSNVGLNDYTRHMITAMVTWIY